MQFNSTISHVIHKSQHFKVRRGGSYLSSVSLRRAYVQLITRSMSDGEMSDRCQGIGHHSVDHPPVVQREPGNSDVWTLFNDFYELMRLAQPPGECRGSWRRWRSDRSNDAARRGQRSLEGGIRWNGSPRPLRHLEGWLISLTVPTRGRLHARPPMNYG